MTFNSSPSPRGALGYCFVEMSDEATAERCLRKVNGKSMPGASPVLKVFPEHIFLCVLFDEDPFENVAICL